MDPNTEVIKVKKAERGLHSKGKKPVPAANTCQIIQRMGPSQLLQVLSLEFLSSVSDFSKFALSWNSSNLMLCPGIGRKGVLQGWIPSH